MDRKCFKSTHFWIIVYNFFQRILIWDASDISNERERLIEVTPKRFKKSAASSIRISRNCISSLLYAQCQLAIGAIFKESSALKITSKGEYSELDAVALKIFGICVNAASVERMWSSMGFLHTVLHNRLMRKGIEVEDPEVEYSEIPEDIENVEDNTNIVNSEYCDNLEGDLLSEYTHPAIDKRARWELRVHL
ncbi:hypothetical protein RhiirA4_469313 [Rhizophagus irregularis]|uniref:HAT C-terminal dimerisation domain-containing protein n=1 Tax=Rhizophagus irregularis TaxID=588596 RepID=A0A2I1GZB5_9GLOM|nr:hypothetical protein RhiirA4_469313 [Rhizophagus irregularis]